MQSEFMHPLKLSWVKLNFFLLFTLSIGQGFSQNNPYYFSTQIDSILQADTTPYKFQSIAWFYAFAGNYPMALQMKDRQFPGAKPSAPSEEQENFFKSFSPQPARQVILDAAAKTNLVIINEAHFSGLHRVFLRTLLKDLYQLGYTFLGMEALDHSDTLLNSRKYPVLASGYYTQEPCFGNLIRDALETGYTLFAYEQVYEDSTQKAMGRELAQAMNIKKVIDRNPSAKMILYCGYDHVYEDSLKTWMGLPMAGQIKRLTGINPLTIDQTELSEYGIVGNRYRKLMHEDYDAVFADSSGRYFNMAQPQKPVDLNVYHPDTRYVMGRPGWLVRPETQLVDLHRKIKVGYPCLVKIYLETDDLHHAVPIDVIEIPAPDKPIASLIYKHKRQVAVVLAKDGQSQTFQVK